MEDDEDFENALSLAAMEAELKPKVLETFDKIAANYKKLRRQQDKRLTEAPGWGWVRLGAVGRPLRVPAFPSPA